CVRISCLLSLFFYLLFSLLLLTSWLLFLVYTPGEHHRHVVSMGQPSLTTVVLVFYNLSLLLSLFSSSHFNLIGFHQVVLLLLDSNLVRGNFGKTEYTMLFCQHLL